MTRRERAIARLERRREWAASRDAKAGAAFQRARSLTGSIPLGQPILVGHHSEKRHRRTLEKSDNAMRAACESASMADNHRSKAAGIAAQLEATIYSDDPDAPEALRARIAELEAKRAQNTAENAAYRIARKHAPGLDQAATLARLVELGQMSRERSLDVARLFATCPWVKQPHPAYENSNIGGNISRLKKRVLDVERLRARAQRAEDAGGVAVEVSPAVACWSCSGSKERGDGRVCYICNGTGTQGGDRAQVTFAEYPGRAVVDSLKAAGFHWSGGSWFGEASKLPEGIGGAS